MKGREESVFLIIHKRILRRTAAVCAVIVLLTAGIGWQYSRQTAAEAEPAEPEFIRWVDFEASYEALEAALELDIASQETDTPVSWIDLIALAAAKNGNNFSGFKRRELEGYVQQLQEGKSLEALTENLRYFPYYQEAYGAALGGLVGHFEIEVDDETAPGGKRFAPQYGLKAFLPIAKGYPYSDFDDFGVSRTYGFTRRHLGHDFMGATGTPIIAVEGGVVEALGWNQYGGWRIGIRRLHGRRYYYYAHLRQNFPFNKSLEEGSVVQPGDVIGYMGHTGYSTTENVNNIEQPHLHFGMQLIFDESQKESDNEIWIDVYPIVRLLTRHRCTVVKDPETKEYSRVYAYRENA